VATSFAVTRRLRKAYSFGLRRRDVEEALAILVEEDYLNENVLPFSSPAVIEEDDYLKTLAAWLQQNGKR